MASMTSVRGITAYPGIHSHDTQSVIPRTKCIRAPPKEFVIESLSPSKISTIWHYGVRVVPVLDQPDKIPAKTTQPYEIWRRWEDSLDLQQILAKEYERLAELKTQRLANELHSSTRAASFDSLPTGSNRISIQTDLHQHIPRLSKKSNLFRNNSTLIENREEQLTAFLLAVFESHDDLLADARGCTQVREWFGWWKGDNDAWTKLVGGNSYRGDAPLPVNPTISVPDYVFESGSIKVRVDTLNASTASFASPSLKKKGSFIATSPPHRTSAAREVTFIPAPSFRESPAAPSAAPSSNTLSTRRTPGQQQLVGKPITHPLRTKLSLPAMYLSPPHESHSPTPFTGSSSHLSSPRSTVPPGNVRVLIRTDPIPKRPPPPRTQPPPIPPDSYTTSSPRLVPSDHPRLVQHKNAPVPTSAGTREDGQQKVQSEALPPSVTPLGEIPTLPNTTPSSPSSPMVSHTLLLSGRARSVSFGATVVGANRPKPALLTSVERPEFGLQQRGKSSWNLSSGASSPTSPGGSGRRRIQHENAPPSPISPRTPHTVPPDIAQLPSSHDLSFSAPLTLIEDQQEAVRQYVSELRERLLDPIPSKEEEEEARDAVLPSAQTSPTNEHTREPSGARPFVTSVEALAHRNARVIMLTPSPTPSEISSGIRPPSLSSDDSGDGKGSEEFAKQFEVIQANSTGAGSAHGSGDRHDSKFSSAITMIRPRSKSHANLSNAFLKNVGGGTKHRLTNSLSSITSSTKCVDLQHPPSPNSSNLIGMSAQALVSGSESSIPSTVFRRARSVSSLSSNIRPASGSSSMVERLRNIPKEMGFFSRTEPRGERSKSPRRSAASSIPSLLSSTELGYMAPEDNSSGKGVETNVSQPRPMSARSDEGSNYSGSSGRSRSLPPHTMTNKSIRRSISLGPRIARGSGDGSRLTMQHSPAEEEVDPYFRTLATNNGGIVSLTMAPSSSYAAPNSPGSPKISHHSTSLPTHFESEQPQLIVPQPSPTALTPRQFHLPWTASQSSYLSPTVPTGTPIIPAHSLRQLKPLSSFRMRTNPPDTHGASTPTTPPYVYVISLKVLHVPSRCAVMLRVPRTVSFLELRERISKKFEDVESIPPLAWDGEMEKRKKLVLYRRVGGPLTQSPPISPRVGRLRSASTTSNAPQEVPYSADFVKIDSEEDWNATVSDTGEEKVSFRIHEELQS